MFRLVGLIALISFFISAPAASATNIEAVRNKKYRLTKQHGPWMIMVASFHEPPPERRIKGLTPEQAADELVYELRSKGIPAYTFSQGDVVQQIDTTDRWGRPKQQSILAQNDSVSVLAGNYPDAEDHVAQKTLAYVKKFHPKYLRDVERSGTILQKLRNGGIYRKTPGRSGPLSGAFLTVNPLLSPDELLKRKTDPLLVKLNSGAEFSLLDNPGKYTLVIASFYGKSKTQVGTSRFGDTERQFDEHIGNTLDQAATSAWQLANTLRRAQSYGYDQNFEAYVYHDRYHSIVTVGAFDSPDDPRIKALGHLFSAKVKTLPDTGKEALLAEVLTIPRQPLPNRPPEKSWMFDPNPRLIEVPRLR
jgi:hypothetical protein